MNPSPLLAKLHHAATARVRKLRALVSTSALPVSGSSDRVVSWATIEANNLWAEFLRAYYLSGSIGTRAPSGNAIRFTAVTFPDKQAALRYAIKVLKEPNFKKPVVRRRDEPAWHDVNNFIKLTGKVGISNVAQVQAALSYSTSFFEFLTPFRNFYAHRCAETCERAAAVGVALGMTSTARLRASVILCSRLPHHSESVLTEWLHDMEAVMDLLCS